MSNLAIAALLLTAPPQASDQAARDSVAIHENARSAVRFYVQRVEAGTGGPLGSNLPRSYGRDRIAQAERPRLIERLDEYAETIPGDNWIAGHRVGLRVKSDRLPEALEIARNCRASEWWCSSLEAFVLHVSGQYPEAQQVMEHALRTMPDSVRCAWSRDLAVAVHPSIRGRYLKLPCAERAALEEKIWVLADPFFLSPGNERATEQLARWLGMRLHHEYVEFYAGGRCDDPHHERTLRRGWPPWWWSMTGGGQGAQVWEPTGYRFLPTASALDAPTASDRTEWTLEPSEGEELFDLPYRPMLEPDHQTAFFRSGDSTIVLVAADIGGPGVQAGVALLEDLASPVIAAYSPQTHPARVRLKGAAREYLVSVEAIAPGRGAARVRYGHGLPPASANGLQLSDLLLFEWRENEIADKESAGAVMLPTTRIARADPVGLYWETYGADSESLEFSLAVEPLDRSFLRRAAEALRLADRANAISYVWSESPAEGQEATTRAKSIRVDVTNLQPGRYVIRLSIRDPSGGLVQSHRHIQII